MKDRETFRVTFRDTPEHCLQRPHMKGKLGNAKMDPDNPLDYIVQVDGEADWWYWHRDYWIPVAEFDQQDRAELAEALLDEAVDALEALLARMRNARGKT